MSFFSKLFGLGKDASRDDKKAVVARKSVKEYPEASYAAYGGEVDPVYLKPLKCGLLPGDVVLLDWMKGKSINKSLPDYFALLYGLDPDFSVRNLIAKGYIKLSSPFEALSALKVAEIKDILKCEGLPVTGKKHDLIERVVNSIPEPEVARHISEDAYSLTNSGSMLLEEYHYIPFAHKNRMGILSVAEMLEYTEEERERIAGADIGTEILLKRLKVAIESKDFFIARGCFLNLAKINNSNKDIDSCVIAYLCMFICDVSGWANNGDYHENNIFDEHCATVASRLIGKKVSADNLRSFFDKAWSQIGGAFPMHYLGKELTYECLIAGFEKDTATIRRLLNLDNRKERDYSSYKF